MKHRCMFRFEKRKLFGADNKKDILSSIADVFREACLPEYSCVEASCSETGAKGVEVCITFTDDAGIQKYNSEHRGIDRPTDVLSFPAIGFDRGKGSAEFFDIDPETNMVFLGDVVISVPRAREQAEKFGHSFKREISFLSAHSFLHLLGYDHEKPKDEKEMNRLQEKILSDLGIVRA